MQKINCYVDESGQETKGALFIVSVVIAEEERDYLIEQLEEIEQTTGKGRVKWVEANDQARLGYIRQILKSPAFKGKINYAIYRNTIEYLPRTVLTTARAITRYIEGEYKVSVWVDGLPKSQTKWFGRELRHLRIRIKKVRGIRKEETSALIRRADAACGLVHSALKGRKETSRLLERAKARGYIKEL